MAELVSHRAGAGLVSRHWGDRRAVVRLRSPEAAMTSVADEAARPGRVPLYDHARPLIDQTRAESSPRLLVLHTWVQTQRLLIRWGHDVQTVIQALILPSTFLVSINLVFGKPVSAVSGHIALYGSVPMAALVGAVFGSTASGICLMREREEGLLARCWVCDSSRGSPQRWRGWRCPLPSGWRSRSSSPRCRCTW